jgi:ribosomal protein S18 acetylase RimI-like enzyme
MPTRESVRLRDATAADLPAMARLHRRAYSREHFLVFLPDTELAAYYGRFLGGGSRIVLAIGENDEPVGFAVYGRNIETRLADWKRERRSAIFATALRHPLAAARRVMVSLTSRMRGASTRPDASAALLSIAVGHGGRGIGRLLLEDMLRWSAESGETRIGLWVRHENVGALNAYLRVGFRVMESTVNQYYMERELANDSLTRTGNGR